VSKKAILAPDLRTHQSKDPQVRGGARGETRTPTASRPPDPKVARATHEIRFHVSSCVVWCRCVSRVSPCREQDVSKSAPADVVPIGPGTPGGMRRSKDMYIYNLCVPRTLNGTDLGKGRPADGPFGALLGLGRCDPDRPADPQVTFAGARVRNPDRAGSARPTPGSGPPGLGAV